MVPRPSFFGGVDTKKCGRRVSLCFSLARLPWASSPSGSAQNESGKICIGCLQNNNFGEEIHMETIELGSVYLDGQARNPGCFSEESSDVTVGNTMRGKALEWVQYKDLLIATRCACFSVSWENLIALASSLGHQSSLTAARICAAASSWAQRRRSSVSGTIF